jgi:hypothetical protein
MYMEAGFLADTNAFPETKRCLTALLHALPTARKAVVIVLMETRFVEIHSG